MSVNYGKKWEAKVKEDFAKLPNSIIDRIYDVTSGHKSIKNPADFIGFIGYPGTGKGNMYYLEVKSIHGNTFPLANLTQYETLKYKVGIPGVRVGVILWFVDHSKVCYCPISTFTKLKEDEKKSVNVKMLDTQEYNIKEIPSFTKRVFPTCDYSCLMELKDGE